MPVTSPHRLRIRAKVARPWSRWVLFAVLCAGFVVTSVAPAEAASSTKNKPKPKKKSASKAPVKTKKPAAIKPARRDASGPQAVPDADAESDGEGDLDDIGGDIGNSESELEAIERELLAQPVEPEPEARLPDPPAPVVPSTPRWLKHVLIPGETLDDVAARYQVEVGDLARWNAIKVGAPIPRKKKDLRVHTVTTPPPREKIVHLVKRGDTWDSIAAALDVDVARLRRWNPRLGNKLDYKQKPKVNAWRDLDLSPTAELATKLAQIRVRAGGLSIGKPNRGRLVRGVELPERPDLYTRARPDQAYGSTHTVMQMLAAITRFRHESGYAGQLVIRGMSRAQGGRFRPHKSHQSGRDVDIRLPLRAAAEGKKHTTSADVDWKAVWKLMRAFLDTGEVEYIFLEFNLQKHLYKAAREAGVPREQLDAWMEWPIKIKSRTNKRVIIRHVEGHRTHMHVRVRCGPHEKHCHASR